MLIALVMGGAAVAGDPVVCEFQLRERFGVSHPDQIVLFEAPADTSLAETTMIDADGRPVAFQVLSDGLVAVRTALPAGETLTWRLVRRSPGATPPSVTVTKTDDGYEICNDLTGMRIPLPPPDLATTPAPIQGIRLRDGTWTATGPNAMPLPARKMAVTILEQGPLLVRAKVAYVFDKSRLHSHRPELPDVPAGEGNYSTIVEVQAGQPSILLEEDSEVDIHYAVDIDTGLAPDQARYRGHHATSVEKGREVDGSVYSYGQNQRHDAIVDVRYDGMAKDRWSATTFPFMSHWDPWSVNTGFYWQFFASKPHAGDNLLGIFAGKASRLIQPALSGVSIDTSMREGRQVASLQVRFQRLMPTQFYSTRMRFGWGIFLGHKSSDLKPPAEVQGINHQMNLHAGFNLTHLARLPRDLPEPRRGYGSLYTSPHAWKWLVDRLQEERRAGGKAFFGEQYNANPYLGPMLKLWAEPTREQADAAAREVIRFAHRYLDTLVNGEGIYEHTTHYFMGASKMSSYVVWIDALLASELLDETTADGLEHAAVLFGAALRDKDLTPTQPDAGVNMGPANMSSMWTGTRDTYTLFLCRHPFFAAGVDDVRHHALELLHDYTNEHGACSASAHYTAASMVPIVNLLQQMQMAGLHDAFADEERLVRYAEWEMQLLTPPEPRFDGLRKIIAVGDGSTEQSVRLGQLATAFAKARPATSARLMGAWKESGSPQDNFYGASILKIDPSLPSVTPNLGDAQFPGWLSVLRHGWGTPDESAFFFVNGDFLTDHRHDDNGSLVLYALGAPLSVDWGSMYAPRVAGGGMHGIVLPQRLLRHPWSSDDLPLDHGMSLSTWWNTMHAPLLSFRDSAVASATFSLPGEPESRWRRTLAAIRFDPAHPVVVIDDLFFGATLAGQPVVSTLNLMASGAVQTPAGAVNPPERFFPHREKGKQQLPSGGSAFSLQPGLTRLSFTGQWLIDWDLFVDTPAAAEAAVGNWGHDWHPTGECRQFAVAQGRPFEERQHILRIKGQDRLRMIILPRRKGEEPPTVKATQGAVTISCRAMRCTIVDGGIICRDGDRLTVTAFAQEPVGREGVLVAGGPAEIAMSASVGTARISGQAGDRALSLPPGWRFKAHPSLGGGDGRWTIRYEGDEPLVLEIEKPRS
jgi:hypothetical protein